MYDPENLLSTLFKIDEIAVNKTFMNVPNIRDSKGHLIIPDEYKNKLNNGSVVVVNGSPIL